MRNILVALALTLAITDADSAAQRPMNAISTRWRCEFKQPPQASHPVQGIECTNGSCGHEKAPLTYIELTKVQIDFEKRTISWVRQTRWFPEVRTRIQAQLKSRGQPDDTARMEEDKEIVRRVTDVQFSESPDPHLPAMTTLMFADEYKRLSVLTVIGNGMRAIMSSPVAFNDELYLSLYFGSCTPE